MKKQKTILRRLLVFVLALALLMPVAGPAHAWATTLTAHRKQLAALRTAV